MSREKKQVNNIDYKKKFIKIFDSMALHKSRFEVWNDFLSMCAISIANRMLVTEREEREAYFLQLQKRYTEEEYDRMTQLFAIAALALDKNTSQDFLGELYHELNLNQHQKGQFFTPYHISDCMAKMMLPKEQLEMEIARKGFFSISDPSCGSGVMLIAAANICKEHGVNYQKEVLFVAQDIDRTAALMCYIQLSLLGCPAVIIIGNSLAEPGLHPDNDVWITPLYYLNAWQFRSFFHEDGALECAA